MFDINTKHLPDRKSHKTKNNYIVSVIGIGQLVFKISVIGISVKSHIGSTLVVIDTIMTVTKYSKQPTKLSTKKSPKLKSF